MSRTELLDRRRVLTLFGAAGLAIVAAACSDGGSDDSAATSSESTSGKASGTRSPTASTANSATTSVDCVLTPEMTEGPYYLDDQAIRRDITEGRAGIPLRLELTVADVATCTPTPGLMVEVWHADASGAYSGFGAGGSGTTFLRGGQSTDGDGVAVFDTIYPGWYRGRTVHIHVKVHDGSTAHTTQLFFDQGLTDDVFTKDPYRGHSGGTTNSQDDIYGGGGSTTTLRIAEDGGAYVGTITLGVRR